MKDKFYFIKQPVVDVDDKGCPTVLFYELLLRETSTKRFPGTNFFDFIATELGNYVFLNFLARKIQQLLKNGQQYKYSVNIETVQIDFNDTYLFLNNMKAQAANIILEITERQYSSSNSIGIIKFVSYARKLGYTVLIDDIDNYNNSNDCNMLLNEVDGIKFSHQLIKQNPLNKALEMISKFQDDYGKYDLLIIVEGVDDQSHLHKLRDIGINNQQGYYFIEKNSNYLVE